MTIIEMRLIKNYATLLLGNVITENEIPIKLIESVRTEIERRKSKVE